jgi:CXXX repeat peptide maturase
MYKHLIVLLDNNSVSFCYYNNIQTHSQNKLMSLDNLKQIAEYAEKNNIAINFIYPDYKLPEEYKSIIEKTEHVKIVPIDLINLYKDAVYVIDGFDRGEIESIKKNSTINLILRLEKADLPLLSEIFSLLYCRFKRLNLILLDITSYCHSDFEEYARQLEIIEKHITGFYIQGLSMELSLISDRLLLTNMNNCDAGIKHVTFAPDGKFYICPAFYNNDSENNIGNLETGIKINNSHLLSLEFAPICQKCDAFHCKRCIYFNKITTLEVNTPSHEQCVVSHLERNVSKNILESLKLEGFFQDTASIPELNYLDPFEIAAVNTDSGRFQHLTTENISENEIPVEKMTDREIMLKIYYMQKEIIKKLSIKH